MARGSRTLPSDLWHAAYGVSGAHLHPEACTCAACVLRSLPFASGCQVGRREQDGQQDGLQGMWGTCMSSAAFLESSKLSSEL